MVRLQSSKLNDSVSHCVSGGVWDRVSREVQSLQERRGEDGRGFDGESRLFLLKGGIEILFR